MHSESLTDVKIFLRDTLVQEKLSCAAEKERLRILQYLDSRESSPAPYLDMSPNNKNPKPDRDINRTNECYEEFASTRNGNSIENSDKSKDSNRNSSARSSSSLYYNLSQALKSSSSWDINDDRPSVPQKELRNSLSNSSAASTRNSLCSLTVPTTNSNKRTGTDSPDAVSESSSNSNNCSSKTDNSSPEVLTISASALRYSATKCGQLSRKEKFLFLDHYKQYWAGLLGHNLYVYCSDKDSKPVLEVDVEGYQARPVGLKDSTKKDCSFEIFSPGNKTYQFTAPCAFEMDQWISAICQAGRVPDTPDTIATVNATSTKAELQSQPSHRQLPSLPAELTYDYPDNNVRPVTPKSPEQYEIMNSNPEDDVFYHYISNDKCKLNENVLYKNLEEMAINGNDTENQENRNENLYYNLVPPGDEEHECIYDTIREANHPDKTEKTFDKIEKTFPIPGRIQQIVQQIEALGGNRSRHTSLIQDELYEPVSSPEESFGRTISR